MAETGFLDVPEGKIFYSLWTPPSLDSRPPILFVHAGVSDHTLWDAQVDFLQPKGWAILRYDLFGFGKSTPYDTYLESNPRPKINYIEHATSLLRKVLFKNHDGPQGSANKAIVIGLSMGGGFAISLALQHPELVCGVMAVAAGLSGFDCPGDSREDAMQAEMESLTSSGEIGKATALSVHYWGDGPLQQEGRIASSIREKLHTWGLDITKREFNKTGGFAFQSVRASPPAVERLKELRVPVAVGIGMLDETATVATMEHLGKECQNATIRRFDAGHMVNLEFPNAFNEWLEGWLKDNFLN